MSLVWTLSSLAVPAAIIILHGTSLENMSADQNSVKKNKLTLQTVYSTLEANGCLLRATLSTVIIKALKLVKLAGHCNLLGADDSTSCTLAEADEGQDALSPIIWVFDCYRSSFASLYKNPSPTRIVHCSFISFVKASRKALQSFISKPPRSSADPWVAVKHRVQFLQPCLLMQPPGSQRDQFWLPSSSWAAKGGCCYQSPRQKRTHRHKSPQSSWDGKLFLKADQEPCNITNAVIFW